MTRDSDVTGVCVEPVKRALEAAGLPHQWILTPPLRQLRCLQLREEEAHAGVGWFRTPERERWARFSKPIYQDGPWVAVMRRSEGTRFNVVAASELLRIPGLRVLVKGGYRYGAWLEGLWQRYQVRRDVSPTDMLRLLECVAAGRADCVFLAREEAEVLLNLSAHLRDALQMIALTDSPAGPTRHVMFGVGVPVDWVERFDRALGRLERGAGDEAPVALSRGNIRR